jgi:mono/diheme cytochrome c family protein
MRNLRELLIQVLSRAAAPALMHVKRRSQAPPHHGAMRTPSHRLAAAALLVAAAAASAQPASAPSRGQLLYTTHCIACHSTQLHWRDQRQARDWDGLKAQVRRWQGNAALGWSEADIVEVARHLNDTLYHYPQGSDRLSQAR